MAERAHPEDPAFQGTLYEQHLRQRYARCQSAACGSRVLDAACGTGWGTSLLQDAASVTGVDISVEAVRYGGGHFPGIAFAAANLAALPFADGSFDCVLCLEGLEHLFLTEAAAFVREAHRVLRNGGRIVVSVPLLDGGKHSGNPWHLFEYSREDIERLVGTWFETAELEVIEGPEGSEVWFTGLRRPAPIPQTVPQSGGGLARDLVASSVSWTCSIFAGHGAPYTRGGQVTVISTALAILHLESARSLHLLPEQSRNRWREAILSAQQPETGLFQEPLSALYPAGPSHGDEYLLWQTTYFALAALDALDIPARYPLGCLDSFLPPGTVEAWMAGLDWRNPWLESNRVMFLLHSCIHAVERQDSPDLSGVYHRVLDWLDQHQHPETGLWGTEQGAPFLNAVAGAYHFIPFYEYVHRPVRAVNRIIDSALTLQKPDGLFGSETGGGACEDLDAIDVLATLTRHSPHRGREIRVALVRAWWAIWNLRNPDGSFPYTGKETSATYSFSGWPPLTAGLRVGDIWATWFRMQALATVAAAFAGDVPAFDWQWRRWPALGYRSDGYITPSRRERLPRWLRRLQAPPPGDARVTVVIPCYNLGRYLHEAIASVLGQTLQGVRVIVADDGSTDPFTCLLLDHWPYDGIGLIRLEHRGVAAARNAAIERAGTDYICCLDADDLLRPAFLEKAVRVLDGNPGAGFVTCHYALFDNEGGTYRYTNPNLPAMLARNEAAVSSVFRKAAWESAGGYCGELSGLHDWDFWIGILEQGYRGELLPEILFDYRCRPGSMYSNTVKPANYSSLIRSIVARHEGLFRAHLVDAMALKSRQFIELVSLRVQENEQSRLTIESLRRMIGELEAAVSERSRTVELLDEGKRYHEQQAANWQAEANLRGELIAGLTRQVEALSSQQDTRPGIVRRAAVGAALIIAALTSPRSLRNLALWLKVQSNPALRRLWKSHFDSEFYLSANPDVLASGAPPALHYLRHGAGERRQCSPSFDSRFYLRRHPDVAAAGIPPLLHWVIYGADEKRTLAEAPVPPLFGPRFRSFEREANNDSAHPLVTVVIPCFNYGHYLAETLDSVQRQTLAVIETIVVEGGSTDGSTPATVRDLERSGLPATLFLYRGEPHLTGDNRNFGIDRARGKYVCCLDADDKLNPVYLEVTAFLAETYGYDLVFASVQAFGGATWQWIVTDPDPSTITEANQISTAALFRRTAWEETGGFRDFGRGDSHVAEDWELWVRMLRTGFRAKCIPQALHCYRVHPNGLWHHARGSVEYQRKKIVEASAELLKRKIPIRDLSPQPGAWQSLLGPPTGKGSILLALPFVTVGGAEKIFETIIRRELAGGRKVVVITTLVPAETTKDASAHFQSLTPNFYALPALFGEDTRRWDDFLSYLIDRYSIDVVMIAGCDYLYHALPGLTAAFPSLGVVDQLFNDQVHFPTNRHYAQFIDVTIVPSDGFADRVVHEFGERFHRVAVIPHGVEVLPPEEVAPTELARQRGQISPEWKDRFIVGFVGRMSPEKAPLDFVEIVNALRHEPGMAFVMAGEGPELAKVRRRITERGLDDLIFAPGFVEDARDIMMAADVIVVPSRLDGMPLVVMESQALGKPVVASAVGSIPVMVEHGNTGLLCEPGDIGAFAALLRQLHASPNLRGRIGMAGRESVARTHGTEVMMRRYAEAFGKARANRRAHCATFAGSA